MKRRFKWFALCLTLLLACSLLMTLPTRKASAQKGRTVDLSENVLRQIQSLVQEKESRSASQRKIDSQLLYAAKQNQGLRLTNDVSALEVNVNDKDGMVPVDIQAHVTRELLKSITKLGGEVIFASAGFNSITARVPLQSLELIASSEDVKFVYPADRARTHGFSGVSASTGLAAPSVKVSRSLERVLRPDFGQRAARVRTQIAAALASGKFSPAAAMLMPTGPVDSQGDVTHRAAEARSFFGVTGSGVKVGVLSDGVNSLAGQQAAGELPAVTVLPGQAGAGDEGTAMLEIVNDMAPGAQLFFATAFTSQASFAQNILDLRTAGCDIIVDDVGYFREAVFQDDNVARSVNTVTASGGLYFSSAGNEGNKDDNTSGVWEGDFVDSGTATVGTVTLVGGTVHNFGGGVLNDQLTAGNGGAPIGLFWSDPLGGSSNDYDLYILDAGLTVVVSAATNIQNGTQDPVELSSISPAAGRRFVIFKKTGAAVRAVHLNTFRGRLAINTTGQTHGHSSAADAYSVAATPAAGPIGAPPNPVGPFPGPFNAANVSELFSSDGPRRVFFTPTGVPLTPGNFLFGTNGGVVRQKPDITAADGTNSAVPGFNPFFGTSAAAPHAAAIAALLKSAVPALTPAQIRTGLTSSAIDIEAAGTDRDTGAGIVMAFQALQAVGATPQALIVAGGQSLADESCPPSNNAVDPGERVTVGLSLTNSGGSATSNLVATLQSSANVIAPSGPQTYGLVAPSATVTRDFSFTANGTCGNAITLTLQLQDGATNLGTVTYSVTLGSIITSAPTTFSNATPIVIPASGTAAPYPSSINVAGLTGSISNVTVTLKNLNHTFPEDVGILLVGPGGQKFVVLDGVIGGTPWSNITYTLSDAGATVVPKPGTPVSGTFKPTAYFSGDVFPAPAPGGPNQEPAPVGTATFGSVFNGANPNGTWSLYVVDFAAGDSGNIANGWDLTITTASAVCTTPCGGVRLSVTTSLTRPTAGTVQALVTVQNTGSATANSVVLATAKLGATNGTPLPQSLGNLAPGGSVSTTVNFANSTPGASSTLSVSGTYAGGNFSSTKRVTIP